MNDRWELLREFAPIVLFLGVVVWGLWDVRRRLSPWHLIIPGAGAAVSLPITFYFVSGARAGEFTGWGGLGVVMLLLPAVFVAALSVTALLTLAILIPRYGFNPLTPEQRAELRRERRSPEGQRKLALFKLKASAVMLIVALLLLKLRIFER